MDSLKIITRQFKSIATLITLCFLQVVAFAQDKKVDVDINTNKGGGNWYTAPWVWIVGVAVFILLIVALTRGNSNRD